MGRRHYFRGLTRRTVDDFPSSGNEISFFSVVNLACKK